MKAHQCVFADGRGPECSTCPFLPGVAHEAVRAARAGAPGRVQRVVQALVPWVIVLVAVLGLGALTALVNGPLQ